MGTLVELRIHWFTVTIWGTEGYALKFWEEWFQPFLGALQAKGFGGRGFRNRYEGMLASKVYVQPISFDPHDKQTQFFSIELPGSACECIPAKDFQILMIVLRKYETFRVTRLDLAWDGVDCSPDDFSQAVIEDRVRSLAKRESLTIRVSPYKTKDSGTISTMTVTFGSRFSGRRIQFYDRRGYTRVELETKKERADLVARDLLVRPPDEWPKYAAAHLRDYLDVFKTADKQELEVWWQEIIDGQVRANSTVSQAREIELNRLLSWIGRQVSPALSVLADTIGNQSIEAFIVDGRRKRGPKYRSLLEKARQEKEEE